MTFRITQCPDCAADIIWTTSERGIRTAVDAKPSVNGTIRLVALRHGVAPMSIVTTVEEALDSPELLRTNHLGTCPNKKIG